MRSPKVAEIPEFYQKNFWMLVGAVCDDGFIYMKRRGHNPNWLKVLEKTGAIGVATVSEFQWGNSTKPSNSDYGSDYFKVWITPHGHEWMQGKVSP